MRMQALLVLVAALSLAGTAHAQTNTERLIGIVDAVDALSGALESGFAILLETLESQGAELLDVLDALSGKADRIESALGESAERLDDMESALRGEISALNSSVYGAAEDAAAARDLATESLDALGSVEARLAAVDQSIGSLESALNSSRATESLEARLAEMSVRLDAIESHLAEARSDGTLYVLVDAAVAAASTLASVENRLESLETRMDEGEALEYVLLEGSTELEVDSYDYKRADDDGDRYEMRMTFSCSRDVYLTGVSVSHREDQDPGKPDGRNANAVDGTRNTLYVDGRPLFDTAFQLGGSTVVYDAPADYGNRPLAAGAALRFESTMHDRASSVAYERGSRVSLDPPEPMIAGSSASRNLPLYDLTVEWLSYGHASCSLSFGSAVTAGGLGSSSSLLYGVSMEPGDASLRKFGDLVDCGGEPVVVTGIVLDSTGWALAPFVDFRLSHGGETAKLEFDPDAEEPVVLNADEVFPLYIGRGGLEVFGTAPLPDILVSLQYRHAPGTHCSVESLY